MDYWSEWHMTAPVHINVTSCDKSCHITGNVRQWRNTLNMSLFCILALVPRPEYSGITIWISGLHFVSQSRQQPWHWQRRTHESLSSTRKVFNDLCHLVVGTPWRSYDATVLAVVEWNFQVSKIARFGIRLKFYQTCISFSPAEMIYVLVDSCNLANKSHQLGRFPWQLIYISFTQTIASVARKLNFLSILWVHALWYLFGLVIRVWIYVYEGLNMQYIAWNTQSVLYWFCCCYCCCCCWYIISS